MVLFKTWRENSKFRKNFLIGLVILILVLNFTGQGKKTYEPDYKKQMDFYQAVPQLFNWFGSQWTKYFNSDEYKNNPCLKWVADSEGCLSNGCVFDPQHMTCVSKLTEGTEICPEDNLITTHPDIYPLKMCAEGLQTYTVNLPYKECNTEISDSTIASRCSWMTTIIGNCKSWRCVTPEVAKQLKDLGFGVPSKNLVCDNNLGSIASILDSIWPKASSTIADCNVRAYLVIGAGALMFLMII